MPLLRFASFVWLCAKHAWAGCWTRANELAAVVGGGCLWFILLLLSPKLREQQVIEAPTTYWGSAGLATVSAIVSIFLAFVMVFAVRFALAPSQFYWMAQDKLDAAESAAGNQHFKLDERIYAESHSIKWLSGDEDSPLFLTIFYLIVGNATATGQTLKATQARIFFHGEPVISRVKETGGRAIDIRHGEWAFFEIGRIVSPKLLGLMKETVVLDDEAKRQHGHNVPLGFLSFEVHSASGKREYGLGHNPELPTPWPLLVVVSADDVLAMQARLTVEMRESGTVVTCKAT
jgi:hypothetical protein